MSQVLFVLSGDDRITTRAFPPSHLAGAVGSDIPVGDHAFASAQTGELAGTRMRGSRIWQGFPVPRLLRPEASARKVWTSRRARVRVPAITARPLWYGLD